VSRRRPVTGLILPGGGARAAYQVGVLAGIAELYEPGSPVPFPVIAGTSAGAMNAAYLASRMGDFAAAAGRLRDIWGNLEVGDVYRAEYRKILGVLLHWIWSVISGGLGRSNPRSLLDNTPLKNLLIDNIDFDGIGDRIDEGLLRGLAITVAGYASERSLSYFQAAPEVQSWWRERREGRPASIAIDHVMASLALPIVFPAVKLRDEWCGDGSTRQFAPLSPAIHLGAERLLVIDIQHRAAYRAPAGGRGAQYPSISRVAGYLMDTIFSDSLYADLERLQRINRTLAHIPEEVAEDPGMPRLHRIETMLVAPSRRPARIAAGHVGELPTPIRWLLGSLGGEEEGGDLLLSYMLFEGAYCRELIELGLRDARARSSELRRFLGLEEPARRV